MNRCRFLFSSSFLLHPQTWGKPSYKLNKVLPLIINVPCYREKGHSKWANIRHTKEAKDKEKSAFFNKYIGLMKVAIADGGGNDPEFNSRLAAIIDNAKRHNMPSTTIQGILKGSADKPMQAVWFELKGPNGSVLYISTISPHSSIVRQAIKVTVRRLKCRVDFTEKMAKGVFEFKGVILAEPPPGVENIEETGLEHAIETGAEEVSQLEDEPNVLEFITPASGIHKTRQALEQLKYTIKDADCVYIPRSYVELEEEDLASLQNLYNELIKLPEVVQIYTNF